MDAAASGVFFAPDEALAAIYRAAMARSLEGYRRLTELLAPDQLPLILLLPPDKILSRT